MIPLHTKSPKQTLKMTVRKFKAILKPTCHEMNNAHWSPKFCSETAH